MAQGINKKTQDESGFRLNGLYLPTSLENARNALLPMPTPLGTGLLLAMLFAPSRIHISKS
jgi:hypothetical protein